MNNARTFIDTLYESNPDCKVVLIGLQMPSIDGMGTSYGASSKWHYIQQQDYAYQVNQRYTDLSKEYKNNGKDVDYVNFSGQFDADNGYDKTERPLNCRTTTKVAIQNNGLHPSITGQMLLADVAFRHFNNKYSN